MKIIFVTPEVTPYSKTGGLADVCGALPIALKELGIEVDIITPRYSCIDPDEYNLQKGRFTIPIRVASRHHKTRVFIDERQGVSFYFIDYPPFRRAKRPGW